MSVQSGVLVVSQNLRCSLRHIFTFERKGLTPQFTGHASRVPPSLIFTLGSIERLRSTMPSDNLAHTEDSSASASAAAVRACASTAAERTSASLWRKSFLRTWQASLSMQDMRRSVHLQPRTAAQHVQGMQWEGVCQHGKRKSQCHLCGGSGVCAHGTPATPMQDVRWQCDMLAWKATKLLRGVRWLSDMPTWQAACFLQGL